MKIGIELIGEERQWRIEVEGYTEQHDTQYKASEFVCVSIDRLQKKPKDIEEELYQQYLDKVSSLERYGSKNVITFDEWKWLKSTIENTRPVCESELNTYKELLGHTTQDIDTLE